MKESKTSGVLLMSNDALDIALIQLKHLRERALQGLLSLDETRQYDILCKNLNLINGDPTTIEGSFKKAPKDGEVEYTEAELIAAATQPGPTSQKIEETNGEGSNS